LDKVSRERVRVRYQDSDPEQAVGSLLDEVRNSLFLKRFLVVSAL